MRKWIFTAAIALPLYCASGVAQTVESSVATVVKELASGSNVSRKFTEVYAAKVSARLGDLDDLARFLTSDAKLLCNLICEARAAPAYFRPAQRPTWAELIRYVFTSTCYGVDPTSRELALRDLEQVLQEVTIGFEPAGLFGGSVLSQEQSRELGRIIIHDLGRAVLSIDASFDPKKSSPNWSSIALLIKNSGTEWNSRYVTFQEPHREAIARQACMNSKFTTQLRQKL